MSKIFGKRFFDNRIPAWQQVGTVINERLTLVEAMEKIVDYKIGEFPVYTFVNGNFVLIPDRKALVRTGAGESPTPLEVVSNNYKPVDEFEIGRIFNKASEVWRVETIGVLNDGRTLFATLDAGLVEIQGDLLRQFFLITDSKDRRRSTTSAYTPVRVVCSNTLTTGLREATWKVSIPHRGENIQKLENIGSAVEILQQTLNQTNNLFSNMAQTYFSIDDFKKIVEQVYPTPKLDKAMDVTDEYNRLYEKATTHQEAALELFVKFNDEHPKIAQTKWGAWNAVVELEDWKEGRSGQYQSAVVGQRANQKAYALDVILKA